MVKLKGELIEDRVILWEINKAKKIYEDNFFGKIFEDRVELALIEAAYLLEKKKIKIFSNKKEVKIIDFIKYCSDKDPRFKIRFFVYNDLRDRNLPTRSGFKFGCDFRVYRKGSNPLKRGKKTAREHTKWIVFAVPEGFNFSFPELSRAVRLAHNIRANMLWAVVAKNYKDVKYYSVSFFKP